MKTHTCPVCDLVFPEVQGLALHVVRDHLRNVAGQRVLCWCGQSLALLSRHFAAKDYLDYVVSEHWLAHADRHGGITAHYHAVLLGID